MIVAQISDPHVCASGVLYKGVADSNRMLQEAIDHIHQLDVEPDLVLITGDIVGDGFPEEYEVALRILENLKIAYLVMPGNHDHHVNFRMAFGAHIYLPLNGQLHYAVDDYPLRIVSFDACHDGEHHGAADAIGLAWLDETLSANETKPTLLLLHHPPFISGISYLDEYRFFDDGKLEAMVRKHRNIEAVLVGHVHRSIVHKWAGTIVQCCPSTTTEIALRLNPEAQPQSYLGPPACLIHVWNEKVGLVTHLSYIGKYEGPFNFF
jgi:3',5'-cyclic-AMP phosphodiesterase